MPEGCDLHGSPFIDKVAPIDRMDCSICVFVKAGMEPLWGRRGLRLGSPARELANIYRTGRDRYFILYCMLPSPAILDAVAVQGFLLPLHGVYAYGWRRDGD